MNLTIDLNTIISGIILVLVTIGIKGIFKINGRIVKIETWVELHEKSDDERHADILKRFEGGNE
ncbi:MAG: hypothetical protein Q8O19_01290 [Rectinemataceae bacterium]|nr:hypothetical protein [Rectinemataceae bacterium]